MTRWIPEFWLDVQNNQRNCRSLPIYELHLESALRGTFGSGRSGHHWTKNVIQSMWCQDWTWFCMKQWVNPFLLCRSFCGPLVVTGIQNLSKRTVTQANITSVLWEALGHLIKDPHMARTRCRSRHHGAIRLLVCSEKKRSVLSSTPSASQSSA